MYFSFLLRVATICTLFAAPKVFFAQEITNQQPAPEWAEPIFEDNISDFGAAPGSIELNYLPTFSQFSDARWWGHGTELEAAATARLGVELELGSLFYQNSLGQNTRFFSGMELALQYLLRQSERGVWATGVHVEKQFAPRSREIEMEDAWGFGHFLVFAHRWPHDLGVQIRQRVEFEKEDSVLEPAIGWDAALLWQKRRCTLGFESSADWQNGFLWTAAPQISLAFGDFSIGTGLRLPLVMSGGAEYSALWLARLVYEWD